MHGVPGALEPLVLPGEDGAAGAARLHDVRPARGQRLPLLLLGHVPLVAAGVLILLRHAPSGGNAELGDDHGHGVVPPQHAQVGEIGVDGAGLVIKILLPEHVAYGRAGAGTRPADDLLAVPDGLIVHVHAVENVVEIIGIVGVNVVGDELPGQKGVLGGDVLHVHLGTFHEEGGDVLGVEEEGSVVGQLEKATRRCCL